MQFRPSFCTLPAGLIMLAIISLGFVGCKKTWECKCTRAAHTTEYIIIKTATRKEAKEICQDQDGVYHSNVVNPDLTCRLE